MFRPRPIFGACPMVDWSAAASPRRGRLPHGVGDLAERRTTELRIRRTQPVWKLAGVGSVGGQTPTGIPRLEQLRRDPSLNRAEREAAEREEAWILGVRGPDTRS